MQVCDLSTVVLYRFSIDAGDKSKMLESPWRVGRSGLYEYEESCSCIQCLQLYTSGAYAGGGSGEPPFFKINYIHSIAWHACLACK